ncbi:MULTISPECIES: hypothetical protein [unclassified Pseudomonas]|uniref:hypothetical protein n=1 Tax=unclassified Pseudomonas TaxID=196821 RepID=UPI000C869F9E|nr:MULTISPECIES: hypothetical protein [unclassified Pseudomonas]PMV19687.1 hypothetical protein C1X17_22185 [Pseudomonas sp. FW305-3-2-15-C-TSA2]PMV26915.1 hypothetical protein C1X22_17970 [Pseudomonas sp. DP16D-L5]PMV38583.1 hypothetical protein C1X21_14545 [Pseudomonas sp. FW305-3-2-15-A-LB2]PMV43793.1 hypothetical protein C1X16_19140 [Pseudomonas sp. FW305-3-2-15-C-R2A1]PMV50193.1 hypothetical protein C1X18_17240 [Pseudomonas sp. FW305-3-2-15-C-LB1]
MIDSRNTPDSDDELLQHYRQHSPVEPPASLDAFILNAARREASAPQPNLWQRWLQACQRPRWQMAFATVAGLALMIGVVMREPVPQPDVSTATFSALRDEAPRPAAPAMSAPAPVARMATAPQAESAQVMGSMAEESGAKLSKRAPVVLPSLEEGLQKIVRLREAGESKAADEELLALHARFPDEDLPARLEALQKR